MTAVEMMKMKNIIAGNINRILEDVADTAARCGRSAGEITLVAVTKMRSEDEVIAVMDAGITNIGENRVKDASEKAHVIREGVTFRLIGHLQTNKAALAVRIFDKIDSVDTVRLAEIISEEALKKGRGPLEILVQVNSSGEESKSGFEPQETADAVAAIALLPGLSVKGLMTIGPLTWDEIEIRKSFQMMNRLFDDIKTGQPGFDTLSMGMSGDYRIAIEEGATMIRVGSAIFERR